MTDKQKAKVRALAARIAALTDKAYDVIGDEDDGDGIWIALNNINGAVQDIQIATEK